MDAGTLSVHPTAMIFAGMAIVGAIFAVAFRNILHAIFGLAITIVAVAVLFVYLAAPFVAAMEVVVYVGGISVAMVFAVMFAYTSRFRKTGVGDFLLAALPSLAFFVVMLVIIRDSTFAVAAPGRDFSVPAIGRALLGEYNVVFEALSIILLLAIMGAIVIARKEPDS